MKFSSFGVFHNKLEINAIQLYFQISSCKYIPVLDNGLSASFERKYEMICQHRPLQKLIDNFNALASDLGFKFLNSIESINLQDQIRQLESKLLNNPELEQAFNFDINKYEDSMMKNIYSFSKDNQFNSAIFIVV